MLTFKMDDGITVDFTCTQAHAHKHTHVHTHTRTYTKGVKGVRHLTNTFLQQLIRLILYWMVALKKAVLKS